MDLGTPRRTLTASSSGLVKTEYRSNVFRSRSSSSKFVGFLSNLWLAGYAKIVTNYIYTPGFVGAAVAGAFEIIYMMGTCSYHAVPPSPLYVSLSVFLSLMMMNDYVPSRIQTLKKSWE
jgi:hypothetical protein